MFKTPRNGVVFRRIGKVCVMKKSDFTMRKIEKLYPKNIHCKQ